MYFEKLLCPYFINIVKICNKNKIKRHVSINIINVYKCKLLYSQVVERYQAWDFLVEIHFLNMCRPTVDLVY